MLRDAQEVENKIRNYIRSGVQVVHLVCGGQINAAEQMLKKIADNLNLDFRTWDPAKGFGTNNMINPVQALEAVASGENAVQGNAIVAMHDLHYDLGAIPALVSSLKRLVSMQAFNNGRQRRPLFILTTGSVMNPDVMPYMKMVEMVLPNRQQLSTVFESIQQSIRDESRRECTQDLRHQIVNSLSGLTCPDATDVLAESVLTHGRFCEEVMDTVEELPGVEELAEPPQGRLHRGGRAAEAGHAEGHRSAGCAWYRQVGLRTGHRQAAAPAAAEDGHRCPVQLPGRRVRAPHP